MSEQKFVRVKLKELLTHYMSGPSPDCEERNVADSSEWGLLKTTAVTWNGWNPNAHKVPPASYWGNKRLEVRKGDVIVTKAGPRHRVGVVAYVDDTPPQIMVSGKMIGLRPDHQKTDGRVLAAVLSSEKTQRNLDTKTTGMAESQLNFTNDFLLETEIELPPLETHPSLSRIIAAIEAQIDLTEALIEKYSQIKAGMMQDLFTRGLTPDGKLRPPRTEAPELYQETPIGWIPKEWDYAKLKQFVRSAQYGISTSLSDAEIGIPVLRMNNIQDNAFDVADVKYSDSDEARTLKLKIGDVLYNRTNSMQHVGKTAIWRDELPECSFASYLVRINLHDEKISAGYFAHWMSRTSSQNALRRYATPAVQQVNINPTNLQKICISCPQKLEEQELIVERINQLDFTIKNEQQLLRKLEVQKSGLMHDLLTGERPVKIDDPEPADV